MTQQLKLEDEEVLNNERFSLPLADYCLVILKVLMETEAAEWECLIHSTWLDVNTEVVFQSDDSIHLDVYFKYPCKYSCKKFQLIQKLIHQSSIINESNFFF